MLCELYNRKMTRGSYVLDPEYKKLSPVEVDNAGVVCRSSEFRTTSVIDSSGHFNFRDFDIANILSVGAVDTLKPVTMANHDVAGVADAFDNLNTKLSGDGTN